MSAASPASDKASPAVYFLLSTFWARGYALAMAFAFERLMVYQKAVAFADAVCTLTKGIPRGYFFLADQLNRAALPIAADQAEFGRFSACAHAGYLCHRPGTCPRKSAAIGLFAAEAPKSDGIPGGKQIFCRVRVIYPPTSAPAPDLPR